MVPLKARDRRMALTLTLTLALALTLTLTVPRCTSSPRCNGRACEQR